MHSPTAERIALVTGASRGVGADVAKLLALAGIHVIVNYREDSTSAGALADSIRRAGGQASTVAADISDSDAADAMIADVARRFGRLDMLVLNATSGVEHDAAPADARRENRTAQRGLARRALPLIPAGGHIVFVTSHQAHFYPYKAVPKGYAAIAASERAGETALYAMRSEFDRNGIHFTVVSGEIIDRTRGVRLFTAHDSTGGTVSNEFASAIATAAMNPHPGGVVYVGGSDHPARMSA